MNLTKKQLSLLNTVRGWSENDVLTYLKNNNLEEFQPFCESKSIDGQTLLSLSEGVVAMWRPKLDSKKLVNCINDLKNNPEQYLNNANMPNNEDENSNGVDKKIKPKVPIRSDSLQNSIINTDENQIIINVSDNVTTFTIPKNIEAPKSFLYCPKLKLFENKMNPYLPMKPGTEQTKTNAKLTFEEEMKIMESLGNHVLNDRGYYEMSGKDNVRNIECEAEENSYEELNFSCAIEQEKKKNSLLKRIWRQPLKKDQDKTADDSTNNTEDKKVEIKNLLLLKSKFPTVLMNNYRVKRNGESEPKAENITFKKYKKISNYMDFDFDVNLKQNSKDTVEYYEIELEEKPSSVYETVKNYDFLDDIYTERKTKCSSVNSFECENECYSKDSFKDDQLLNDKPKTIEKPENSSKDKQNEDGVENCEKSITFTTTLTIGDDNYLVKNENFDSVFNTFKKQFCDKLKEEKFNRNISKNSAKLKDSVNEDKNDDQKSKIVVEDYLEPRKCFKSNSSDAMDDLAEEILKLFDATMEENFVLKKGSRLSDEIADFISRALLRPRSDLNNPNERDLQTTVNDQDLNSNNIFEDIVQSPPLKKPPTAKKPTIHKPAKTIITEQISNCDDRIVPTSEYQKPFETIHKWNESLKNSVKKKRDLNRINIAERPLPVPVENEFYYMEVDRQEAESLLEGQPDGTFILRPSSQSNHAYTVTLMYQDRVYNIGCRKRQDGRLALGFNKVTEPNFLTIHELIEYYYNEKLVLLVDGKKVGSTVLKRLHP